MPGLGVSLFLIAVGAILAFAVTASASGFDVNTVGVILMIVGGIGFLASMIFWAPWAPYSSDRRTVVREDRPGRTVVREREVIERDEPL
jgi:hypothetical protein